MVRPSRAAVELLLWLGVVVGLSLLMIWWDVRPGTAADYRPEDGDASSLFTASFLLISAATALVLWVVGNLPLARVAATVTGLTLLLGGGSFDDIPDADYLKYTLWLAGILLWVLVARSSTWQPTEPRAPIPTVVSGVLALLLAPAACYGVLVLAFADADRFPGAVVLAVALLAAVLRVTVADFWRGRASMASKSREIDA